MIEIKAILQHLFFEYIELHFAAVQIHFYITFVLLNKYLVYNYTSFTFKYDMYMKLECNK